jgi:DNA-binding CsgD family transcriptional regulator
MSLVGRRIEEGLLARLIETVRGGKSGVLVLRGDAGVGKTALLEEALTLASGFRIVRTVGVESEVELAFAALEHLCEPMLDRLDGLPGPQRDALSAAFGLSAATTPERFLVSLAALSLLSGAAGEQPLLCVIDDAQWLDRASAQALAFVARRLLADRVAMLFGTRSRSAELEGLPELVVEGLTDEDARTLLASVLEGPLDDRVRDRIVAETRGNPLALLELPRGLTRAQLAVGFAQTTSSPLSNRIEESFRRRLEELPLATQQLLLLASADELGDAAHVWRAARLMGIGPEAVVPAAAGLMEIGTRVQFRHPLVRSAVYRSAQMPERQAVHRALAEATDAALDPDRRAWHLAAAAPGPDEEIAEELQRSADRAQERGGVAAAAAFLERAGELTPDPQARALRQLLAAASYLTAGSSDKAQELLGLSAHRLVDPGWRAQAMRLEGAIRFAQGRGGETPALLFDAAVSLAGLDARLAREALMESFEAAMWAAQLTSRTSMLDVAEAARSLPAPAGDRSTANLLLIGYSERFTSGYRSGVEWWRRAAETQAEDVRGQARHQLLGMVWNATGELLDFERHSANARLRVRLAREEGALATLPVALSCLAWCERLGGRIDAAEALVAEAMDIGAAIGTPAMPGAQQVMRLAILVWRGEQEEARRVADEVSREAVARGQGLAITLARFCLTQLELSFGRYEEARVHALHVFDADPPYVCSMALGDMIEATVRSGDTNAARAALARLAERALAAGTPWGLGLLARGRALLADDEDAETFYEEALGHLSESGVITELARAHLLYGEWLRRQRRRRDARAQLRVAYDIFQATDAVAFAHRASVELLATGEHARARVSKLREQLTPQEQQVAQLAAEGESNAKIAAQLFISQHTVAYHLRKVFAKLGVTKRSQLADALGERFGVSALAG